MALPYLGKMLWITNGIINASMMGVFLAFQLLIIYPEIYKLKTLYYLATFIQIFISFNTIANIIACSLVDTSVNCIRGKYPKESTVHPTWHYCRKCEMLVPPRSIHCDICKICILKRDHHCIFLGSCVGHRNSRYFLMFLFYVAIATVVACIHNSIYFWWVNYETYVNRKTFLKLMIPPLQLWPISWTNAFLMAYELNFALALISFGALVTYIKCFMSGATLHEFRSKENSYDLGCKKCNMQLILGKRMQLVWLAPFIKSELPHDGINWESNDEDIS